MTTTRPQGSLTAEQLDWYHDQGFLVVPGLLDVTDLADLRGEADRLLARADLISPDNMRCRFQARHDTGEYQFDCFDPVVDIAPVCARYAEDRRVRDVLLSLYGEEACLRHHQLIYKMPGAAGYGTHQDYVGWPGFPRTFLTVVLALDAADADNGCIEVFAGCHKDGYLSPVDNEYHELPAERFDPGRKVDLVLQPGDAAFFGCYLPHRSGPNRSPRPRRHLFLCFNAASEGGNRLREHYDYYHGWKRAKYAAHGKNDVYFQ